MLHYLVGDATKPQGDGNKIICHVCNDIGGWGRGFVLAVSARWKGPEIAYRAWSKQESFALGETLMVRVEPDIVVANMVAQRDIVFQNGIPPIRYEALRKCLGWVYNQAEETISTIHMPRIGAGLAGGSWATIEQIIVSEMKNIDTYVYDLFKT